MARKLMESLEVLWVSESLDGFVPDVYISKPPKEFLDVPQDE